MDWRSGQDRRAWLENQGQNAVNALSYYLGPGVPVENILRVADMFNPVADMTRAGTAARGVVRPGATVSERVNALGNVATDMASVLAPVAGAAYADDAARGLTEALANWSMPADDMATRFVLDEDGAIRAWHGSPHDFDRFSMDKIGTGEGAQAYGHGLYFAETPEVAKSYQMMGANVTVRPEPDGRLSVIAGPRGGAQEVIGTYDNADDAFRVMKEQQKSYGRLYEVNIDANPEDFLDWDAPLAGQPAWESIKRDWDENLGDPDIIMERLGINENAMTGQAYLNQLAPNQGAAFSGVSQKMREQGVPGIRYLDAGSRGAGDGSRNYVVFDDRLVDILGKDGQRTTPQGKAQNVLDMLAAGRASEVTDDMLDLGDPVLNAQLNDYLWKNYDLPMDEASRMARADQYFPESGYHSTGADFTAFEGPNERTSHGTHIGTATAANERTSGRWDDWQREKMEARGEYVPDNVLALRYRQENPLPMEDMIHWAPEDLTGRLEYLSDIGEAPPYNVGPRVGKFGGEYFDNRDIVAELQKGGVTGFRYENLVEDAGSMSDAVFDPANIRSRFARFDPRLAHLRNLSAGVGGLGIAVSQQSEQERSDDINDILAKYGVN